MSVVVVLLFQVYFFKMYEAVRPYDSGYAATLRRLFIDRGRKKLPCCFCL